MTTASKLKFEAKDFIKGFSLMFGLMTVYFNLRDDIRENKIVNNADKVIINFRLETLEDLLKVNKIPQSMATLPQQPERKNEDE